MLLQDILSTGTAMVILYESYQPVLHPSIYVLSMSFFAYDVIFNNLTVDFKIHHALTSYFAVISVLYPFSPELRVIMAHTEWSTIVMNSIPYLPKRYQTGLQLLFFALFFKFRIFDWYVMFQKHSFLLVQIIPSLMMYSLNLYWFVLMCKKVAKPLKQIQLNVINHQIVSYTMMVNSLFVIVWYPTLIFTNFMSVLLGMSSYLYHKEIAYDYYGIPSMNSKWIMLDVTIFHIFQAGYMYLLQTDWSVVSLYMHFMNLMYMYKFSPDDNTTASMPSFGVDIIYLLYSNPTIELFTISLLFAYIYLLNPFYDVSYVSTHLVVCWYIHSRANHLLQN